MVVVVVFNSSGGYSDVAAVINIVVVCSGSNSCSS